MATGIVKWFSDAKGYGFIQPDDAGNDVFAHFSAIEMEGFKTLKPGVRVQYELHDGPKGVHALQIVPVDAGKQALPGIATLPESTQLLQEPAQAPRDALQF
nr:cold shock domain-containing protein [Brachymonas denitrificans]